MVTRCIALYMLLSSQAQAQCFCAHVSMHLQIRVWLPGALKPLKARVVALGVECDLAALEPVEPVAASSSDGETSFSNGSSSSFGGTAEAAGMNASAEEAKGSEAGYSTEEGGMEQSEGSVQSLWSQLTPLELGDLPALTTPLQVGQGFDCDSCHRACALHRVHLVSYMQAMCMHHINVTNLQFCLACTIAHWDQRLPVLPTLLLIEMPWDGDATSHLAWLQRGQLHYVESICLACAAACL